jgi:mannose-6-phosphate isomerase-like protein (cupin superfamily)
MGMMYGSATLRSGNCKLKVRKVNLQEKFRKVSNFWEPGIIGRLNGQLVKIARLKGEFTWHRHDQEDELFLVLEGVLTIELEKESIKLHEGEMVIIPRGVLHKPVAEQEVKILLFEPESTSNTGNVVNEFTRKHLSEL